MISAPVSDDARRALDAAVALAASEGRAPDSLHLLRALVEGSPAVRQILSAEGVSGPSLVGAAGAAEPSLVFARLQERAADVATNARAPRVHGLHLLVALLRLREARAFGLLERRCQNVSRLRNAAVAAMALEGGALAAARPQASQDGSHAPARAPSSAPAPQAAPPQRPRPALPPRQSPALRQQGLAGAPASTPARRHEPREAPRPADPEAPPAAKPARRKGRTGGARARRAAPDRGAMPAAAAPRRTRPAVPPLAEVAPTLAECAVDWTERARTGAFEAAVGREAELDAVIDVLGKRRANNPVLVGAPGVGKTAIVEGLARLWHEQQEAGLCPLERRVVALDTSLMVAGTSLRGAFSERFGAIVQEVAAARGDIVVFIDELHMLVGAGASGDGPQDAAGELKTALARGEFPCVGATTPEEFKRYIERDAALERRFSRIEVAEPACPLALSMVAQSIGPYEAHHQVRFAHAALEAAVLLGHRFVRERALPDKAFAALDLAGSRVRRRGRDTVEHADVAQVIHEWTGVPTERLCGSEAARFARAEEALGEHVVGHRHVVEALARALRRGFAGFNGARPMGSFLFLGPTGVGKTEMAKALATFIFGDSGAMVRFDMSELGEKHAVARLLGAQPGYVGYEEGGQLTEALRKRPFQIVLFDEVEKAHPDVLNVLLQVLDEGHLTDAQGRRVGFGHTLVLLTSNLGAEAVGSPASIGFGGRGQKSQRAKERWSADILEAARQALLPELWSRLDDHLVFLPLSRAEVMEVARRQLSGQQAAMRADRRVELSWDDAVVDFLLEGSERRPGTGTRGLRQAIARYVEAPIAEGLLAGTLTPPCNVRLRVHADGQCLEPFCPQGGAENARRG